MARLLLFSAPCQVNTVTLDAACTLPQGHLTEHGIYALRLMLRQPSSLSAKDTVVGTVLPGREQHSIVVRHQDIH